MRTITILIILCLLASCGETRAQLDELSQCREDMTASLLAHRSSALADQVGVLMGAAMDRLDAFVLGTEITLPPPKVRASDLVASPDVAAQEGRDANHAKMHPPVSDPFPWLAALLGAVGIAIPGLGTAMGWISRLRAKLATMTGGLHAVIDSIESVPASQAEPIKRAVAATHNAAVNAEVAKRTTRSKQEAKHG